MATIKIATPQLSFISWLKEECEEACRWNFECIDRITSRKFAGRFKDSSQNWTIYFPSAEPHSVYISSNARYIHLRAGLRIVMKYGRLEVL